jgi:DNA-binding LacI/PurR family transcriptional regulator
VRELGTVAARAMLELLAGRKPVAALPAPQLVVRESTGAPPPR